MSVLWAGDCVCCGQQGKLGYSRRHEGFHCCACHDYFDSSSRNSSRSSSRAMSSDDFFVYGIRPPFSAFPEQIVVSAGSSKRHSGRGTGASLWISAELLMAHLLWFMNFDHQAEGFAARKKELIEAMIATADDSATNTRSATGSMSISTKGKSGPLVPQEEHLRHQEPVQAESAPVSNTTFGYAPNARRKSGADQEQQNLHQNGALAGTRPLTPSADFLPERQQEHKEPSTAPASAAQSGQRHQQQAEQLHQQPSPCSVPPDNGGLLPGTPTLKRGRPRDESDSEILKSPLSDGSDGANSEDEGVGSYMSSTTASWMDPTEHENRWRSIYDTTCNGESRPFVSNMLSGADVEAFFRMAIMLQRSREREAELVPGLDQDDDVEMGADQDPEVDVAGDKNAETESNIKLNRAPSAEGERDVVETLVLQSMDEDEDNAEDVVEQDGILDGPLEDAAARPAHGANAKRPCLPGSSGGKKAMGPAAGRTNLGNRVGLHRSGHPASANGEEQKIKKRFRLHKDSVVLEVGCGLAQPSICLGLNALANFATTPSDSHFAGARNGRGRGGRNCNPLLNYNVHPPQSAALDGPLSGGSGSGSSSSSASCGAAGKNARPCSPTALIDEYLRKLAELAISPQLCGGGIPLQVSHTATNSSTQKKIRLSTNEPPSPVSAAFRAPVAPASGPPPASSSKSALLSSFRQPPAHDHAAKKNINVLNLKQATKASPFPSVVATDLETVLPITEENIEWNFRYHILDEPVRFVKAQTYACQTTQGFLEREYRQSEDSVHCSRNGSSASLVDMTGDVSYRGAGTSAGPGASLHAGDRDVGGVLAGPPAAAISSASSSSRAGAQLGGMLSGTRRADSVLAAGTGAAASQVDLAAGSSSSGGPAASEGQQRALLSQHSPGLFESSGASSASSFQGRVSGRGPPLQSPKMHIDTQISGTTTASSSAGGRSKLPLSSSSGLLSKADKLKSWTSMQLVQPDGQSADHPCGGGSVGSSALSASVASRVVPHENGTKNSVDATLSTHQHAMASTRATTGTAGVSGKKPAASTFSSGRGASNLSVPLHLGVPARSGKRSSEDLAKLASKRLYLQPGGQLASGYKLNTYDIAQVRQLHWGQKSHAGALLSEFGAPDYIMGSSLCYDEDFSVSLLETFLALATPARFWTKDELRFLQECARAGGCCEAEAKKSSCTARQSREASRLLRQLGEELLSADTRHVLTEELFIDGAAGEDFGMCGGASSGTSSAGTTSGSYTGAGAAGGENDKSGSGASPPINFAAPKNPSPVGPLDLGLGVNAEDNRETVYLRSGTILVLALEQRDRDLDNFLKYATEYVEAGKLVMKLVKTLRGTHAYASPTKIYECYVPATASGDEGQAE